MSKSIRISDELAARAEEAAAIEHRSPPQQIEHWAQIGRVMEESLSYEASMKVKQVGRPELDAAIAFSESDAGKEVARQTIRQTSGTIESSD